MRFEQLKKRVLKWLKCINPSKYVLSEITSEKEAEEARGILVQFWGDHHKYNIIIFQPCGTIRPNGYIGATVSNRAPHPGEVWIRGNDLYDGEFSHRTFNAALLDILNHNLLRIEVRKRSKIVAAPGYKKPKPSIDHKVLHDIALQIYGQLDALGFTFDDKPRVNGRHLFLARKGAVGTLFTIEITAGNDKSNQVEQFPQPPDQSSIIITASEGIGRRRDEVVQYVTALADPNCIDRAVSYITTNAHGAFKEPI